MPWCLSSVQPHPMKSESILDAAKRMQREEEEPETKGPRVCWLGSKQREGLVKPGRQPWGWRYLWARVSRKEEVTKEVGKDLELNPRPAA